MPKFSEQTFDNWSRPASENEEQRISNAISMIKDAIHSSNELASKSIDVFIQGSYANNTNVRANSDIDICIMLKDTFSSKYPDGLTREDYGFTVSSYEFSAYRKEVIKSLANKFDNENIFPGNKSIKVQSNSYRIEADVVPCFQYRNYFYENSRDKDSFSEGHTINAQNGIEVISYPKQHIKNGKDKNNQTQRRFKRTVRIVKKIRYHMIENNNPVNANISSFLVECLLWNVPNKIFNDNDTHELRIKETIRYLYFETKDNQDKCAKWREVSERLYLFDENKKWDVVIVNQFLLQIWRYLEFLE